jgi:hypothetical protein
LFALPAPVFVSSFRHVKWRCQINSFASGSQARPPAYQVFSQNLCSLA